MNTKGHEALAEAIALKIIINDPSEKDIKKLIAEEAKKAGANINLFRQQVSRAYHGTDRHPKASAAAAAEFNKR